MRICLYRILYKPQSYVSKLSHIFKLIGIKNVVVQILSFFLLIFLPIPVRPSEVLRILQRIPCTKWVSNNFFLGGGNLLILSAVFSLPGHLVTLLIVHVHRYPFLILRYSYGKGLFMDALCPFVMYKNNNNLCAG
jgi:hypothetical protein